MEEIKETIENPQTENPHVENPQAENAQTESSQSNAVPHGQVPYVIYPYADFTELNDNDEDSKLGDLVSTVAKKVWKQKIWLLFFIVLGTALGVFVAINTPKSYTSKAVLAPEIQTNKATGTMSRAASALGLGGGMNQGTDAIYPDIYPEVLSSPDFLDSLLDVKVSLKKDSKERTYAAHLKKDTKLSPIASLKMWIFSFFPKDDADKDSVKIKKDDPNARFKVSLAKDKLFTALAKSISCDVDKKTSIVTLTFTDQDPLVAAIMLDTIQNRIQEYITTYRTKKARIDFEYYKGLLADAEAKYEKIKSEYVSYCEANIEVQQAGFIVERAALENKMSRAYALTNTMRQQMQGAEAKIQEVKPAFTVIESPKMPNEPSGRSRKVIVAGFLFLGIFLDVLRVLIFKRDKKDSKSKK